MGTQTFLNRMRKELADFEYDPPPLITCYPSEDDITQLEAYLNGPPNTPYEKGVFRLDVTMPETYPFDPPMIRFRTPIYHPNIDECGRICASVLKKGKEDQWKPSMNLRTTLLSLHALIGAPNPDDPLDADIAREYQQDYELFAKKARDHTKRHAINTPDNLISDPFTESMTHSTSSTKPADMDFDSYSDESDRIFSPNVEDTSVDASSKSKTKIKLSLSKLKHLTTQSTTLPSFSSQNSTKNGVKSIPTDGSNPNCPLTPFQIEATSTPQQIDNEDGVSNSSDDDSHQTQQSLAKREKHLEDEKCDIKDHSSLSSPEFAPRNEATNYDNKPKDDMDGAVDEVRPGNLKDGLRNNGDQHEVESNGDAEQSILSGNHDELVNDKDAQCEDRPNEEQHTNNQQRKASNYNDIRKQVICTDLDDEPSDQEQLIHDKTTYVENATQQTPIDEDSDSSDNRLDGVDQRINKNEMDKTCDMTTIQPQLATISSPADKLSNPISNIILKVPAVTTLPLPLTPSTDKVPSPSSASGSDGKGHLMDTASSSPSPSTAVASAASPLRTVTVNDRADWTYTNFYSSHHLTFTANDPYAEAFPTFEEEEEERPITQKRKLKVSLSCKKKKPKAT